MHEIGHLVLSSSPYVSVLNRTHRLTRCDFCFKQLDCDNKFTCKVCGCVSYCSVRCKEHDKSDHESECGYLSSTSSDTARLMIRLLGKERKEDEGETMPDGSKRKLKHLMDHNEHISVNENAMDKIVRTFDQLLKCNYEPLPVFEEFSSLFGKVLINGFTVSDLSENHIATALYLAPSVLDHSCVPNASWSFRGNVLEIRTTEELKDVTLDKLRICYLDPFTGTQSRHSALKNNYYFECICEHCDAGFEYKTFYRNTCKSCMTDNVLKYSLSKCRKCDLIINNNIGGTVLTERVKGYINGNDVNIESAKDIMEKIVETFSMKSIIFLQVSKLLFNQYLQDGRAEDALKYGELCIAAYKHQTQLNPLGNLQTLVKLARLRNSCGLEFDDLVTEVMDTDRKYFKSDKIRESYKFGIEK